MTTPTLFCTGTLIADRVVITAAHCLQQREATQTQVYFGSDLYGDGGQFVAAEEFLPHPSYDPSTQRNDIALVTLKRSPDPAIELAQLSEISLDESHLGSNVRIVGFGETELADAAQKFHGTSKIVAYSETDVRLEANPSMSCRGDSGGPVFITDGEREVLIGLTSYGDDDCTDFAVNTRVDAFVVDFIRPLLSGVGPASEGTPIDPTTDYCASVRACTSDEDCPDLMTCGALVSGDRRCGYFALAPGYFAAECAPGEELAGSSVCLQSPVVDDDRCLQYCPCDDSQACSLPGDAGCGCATGTSDRHTPLLILLFGYLVARTRRRIVHGS